MSGRMARTMRLRSSAGAFFSHRTLRHDAEHRAAVEAEEAVADRDQLEVAERETLHTGLEDRRAGAWRLRRLRARSW